MNSWERLAQVVLIAAKYRTCCGCYTSIGGWGHDHRMLKDKSVLIGRKPGSTVECLRSVKCQGLILETKFVGRSRPMEKSVFVAMTCSACQAGRKRLNSARVRFEKAKVQV